MSGAGDRDMKDFAKHFYKSRQWHECRKSFIASVGGLCTRCLSNGLIVKGYIVHHKILLTPENINNPEITLSHDNLEYLCQACHNEEHYTELNSVSDMRWYIDECGNVCEKK